MVRQYPLVGPNCKIGMRYTHRHEKLSPTNTTVFRLTGETHFLSIVRIRVGLVTRAVGAIHNQGTGHVRIVRTELKHIASRLNARHPKNSYVLVSALALEDMTRRLVGEGEVLVRWVSTVLEVVVEGTITGTAARPAAHIGYDGLQRQEFGCKKRRVYA